MVSLKADRMTAHCAAAHRKTTQMPG